LVDVVVEMASNWLTSPKERMMLQSVLNNFLLVTAPVPSLSSEEDNVKSKVPKECDLDELIKSTRLQNTLKDSFMRAVHELTASNETTSRTSAKGSRKRKHTPTVPPPAETAAEPPVSSFLKEEVVDPVETVDDRQDIAGKSVNYSSISVFSLSFFPLFYSNVAGIKWCETVTISESFKSDFRASVGADDCRSCG
jgi:hypothetical protein